MENWLQGKISVSGVRLHYYRSGGNKPPLVMVHGFTDNALYWTRTAHALAAEWDVILYDARGHGTSDRAGGKFGDKERIADLFGLIEALKLLQPGLMGHSMGATTIALFAAEYPDRAQFVILEDPAWFGSRADASADDAATRRAERTAYITAWRELVCGLQTQPREEALAQIRARSPQWSAIDQNLSLDARRQVELDLFNYYPPESATWREVVEKILCPILLITSEPERGGIVTPEHAREVAARSRSVRWMQIADAGHSIRYDQFEKYLEVVQEFLKEMQASAT